MGARAARQARAGMTWWIPDLLDGGAVSVIIGAQYLWRQVVQTAYDYPQSSDSGCRARDAILAGNARSAQGAHSRVGYSRPSIRGG